VEGIDIMQISGHKNVAFINNYSTLSEERHKKISNILSNTESETNRNASCTFLPVSKARTNKLCILRQCKNIKEEKLIPSLWTLHRFQWKIGIYFYRIK
jgi:hypothetical protein